MLDRPCTGDHSGHTMAMIRPEAGCKLNYFVCPFFMDHFAYISVLLMYVLIQLLSQHLFVFIMVRTDDFGDNFHLYQLDWREDGIT